MRFEIYDLSTVTCQLSTVNCHLSPFEVARGLFVVYQLRDGRLTATDGARGALPDGDGADCIVLASKVSRRLVSSSPTPDDLDELLSLVWKEPAFFIAHPRAIAAFERECTWRGVPPVTTDLFGTKVILWRGVPIVPSDKVEVEGQYLTGRGVGTTKIILVRVGEKNQGVVGLHQSGIPGEIAPSLSARLMGLDKFGVASYLLTKYFSLASLTDDAIAVLENVEVGYYHDYQHRKI